MKTQHRGHCPFCGNEQAVLREGKGLMSKHGYTVTNGWFEGACPGWQHRPVELERKVLDEVVTSIQGQVASLETLHAAYEAGTDHPSECLVRRNEFVSWAEATEQQRRATLHRAQSDLRHRILSGRGHVEHLVRVVEARHGKPLLVVELPEEAPRVKAGERRLGGNGRVLTAKNQDGGRVYWVNEGGFKGWSGVASWRRMELAK